MAGYLNEEEVWKCAKHPSKRHRSGICPVCLRDRLASLCPDCAHTRPCTCSTVSTASSSSSSSSFSRFSASGVGSVGRVSNLIESEPALRRSRSLSVPFLRSKPENYSERKYDFSGKGKKSPFWSVFKSKKRDSEGREGAKSRNVVEERRTMMKKSRSVAVPPVTSETNAGEIKSSPAPKWKGWFFPSPIKAFRQSRVSKLVFNVRSPLYRG
ncbi:hypothetical protein SLE2022_091240 [Rubroshorea leprosula]